MTEELTSYGIAAIMLFFVFNFIGLVAAYYTQVQSLKAIEFH